MDFSQIIDAASFALKLAALTIGGLQRSRGRRVSKLEARRQIWLPPSAAHLQVTKPWYRRWLRVGRHPRGGQPMS